MHARTEPRSDDPHFGAEFLEAGAEVEAARLVVILLHGRGGSAEDMLSLSPQLERSGVAFVAPRASGSSWYPNSFLAPHASNEPAYGSAHALIERLLENIASRGVSPDRCAFVGFSQGACLAVDHAARFPRRYGFVAALTGGLIGPPDAVFDFGGSLDGTPVFLGASDPDPHVPWSRVEQSADVLRRLGAEVELVSYPGHPHAVNADQIRRTRALLDAALPHESR